MKKINWKKKAIFWKKEDSLKQIIFKKIIAIEKIRVLNHFNSLKILNHLRKNLEKNNFKILVAKVKLSIKNKKKNI